MVFIIFQTNPTLPRFTITSIILLKQTIVLQLWSLLLRLFNSARNRNSDQAKVPPTRRWRWFYILLRHLNFINIIVYRTASGAFPSAPTSNRAPAVACRHGFVSTWKRDICTSSWASISGLFVLLFFPPQKGLIYSDKKVKFSDQKGKWNPNNSRNPLATTNLAIKKHNPNSI